MTNTNEYKSLNKIIGYNAAKEEAIKIINLLKNYEEYQKELKELPKAFAIESEAANGKTTIAKAIIENSGVASKEINCKELIDSEDPSTKFKSILESLDNTKTVVLLLDSFEELKTNRNVKKDILNQLVEKLKTTTNVFAIITTRLPLFDLPLTLEEQYLIRRVTLLSPDNDERRLLIENCLKDINDKDVDIETIVKRICGASSLEIIEIINKSIEDARKSNKTLTDDIIIKNVEKTLFGYDYIDYVLDNKKAIYALAAKTVTNVVLNKEYIYVDVTDDPGYNKITDKYRVYDQAYKLIENRTYSQMINDAIASLAELVVQDIFFQEESNYSINDINRVTKALELCIAKGAFGLEYSQVDSKKNHVARSLNERGQELANIKLREYKEKATNIVSQYKEEIALVANALEKNKFVTIKQLKQIVNI